jgi:tryptophanyl-tRNA synthetase
MAKDYIVTPWEVSGEVDYDKLIEEFGTQKLTDDLIDRMREKDGSVHYMLRRKIFFSHRDLGWILDEHEKGNEFALYTGRGPSGHTHLGHLLPWIFVKYLQDRFGAELYFQMTDDEKYLVRKLELEETHSLAYENALDVIAMGFDPKKTFIFSNLDYAKSLYRIALPVAKRTTFSTAKAVFGFTNESNIGIVFFPAMQAAPCFLPSVLKGKKIPALIPAAIDQDPYWRITRDVAPKMGFYKPAAIHCKFIPGLGAGGKMSASEPDTCIFTTDSGKEAERKVMNAFTGGRATVEEQKRLGGKPEICSVFQYYAFLFEEDDERLRKIHEDCVAGTMLCGECKKRLAGRVVEFLKKHQKAREKARKDIDKFMLKDC